MFSLGASDALLLADSAQFITDNIKKLIEGRSKCQPKIKGDKFHVAMLIEIR